MKLLILTHLDVETITQLQANHTVSIIIGANNQNLAAYLNDCDALIYRKGVRLSAELLHHAPKLKLIIRLQGSHQDVDLAYLESRQIDFVRIPQPTARAVAELTFGLMIGLARNIRCMDRRVRRGQTIPYEAVGTTLEGKTLGVIGAGTIGRITGELGHLWGMQVLGCVAQPTQAKAVRLREHGIHLASFEEVLSSADFVTIHVPLTSSSHYLIGERELAQMKSTAFLLNMGAGQVVDEHALYEALVHKRLAGAAIDAHVTSHLKQISPLATLSNVILTPQIGATTLDTERAVGKQIIQCIHEASQS